MTEMNPYAPPPIMADVAPQPMYGAIGPGLWRQDSVLVVRIGTPLPPRCVKTNEPTDRVLKRNLVWYSPWLLLLVLINVLICAIVIMIMQKKATVHIGLSPEWISKRRVRMAIAWVTALAAIPLFILGMVLLEQGKGTGLDTVGGICLALSPFLFLGGVLYGNYSTRMVYASLIDDQFAWIKGVCPEYLAGLPDWTGKRG